MGGATGPFGGDSFAWTFSTTTADADPGAGTFRLNNATYSSANKAFVDLLETGGTDVTAWLDSLDDSTNTATYGRIKIFSKSDLTRWVTFKITGTVVAPAGYRKLQMTYVADSGTALTTTAGDTVITFDQAGDVGATGSNGSAGATGDTGAVGPSGPTGPASGAFIGRQILAASGTYTPTSGTVTICMELIGGGGGGGGCSSSAASAAVGGGGAAGGYLSKCVAVSGTPSVTVGALGSAGANTGGTGGTGGNTILTNGATDYTAKGGLGGVGETAGTAAAFIAGGATGGVSVNGDVNGAGAPGVHGTRVTGILGCSGAGGSGAWGAGGVGLTAAGAGTAGTGKGSGGGGGLVLNNSGAVTGGAGTIGLIVIWEYK